MTGVSRSLGATIVAFDGLIVETKAARSLALAEALSAEHAPCSTERASRWLTGRSLEEAVEAAVYSDSDATTRDLTVLRARRSYSGMVQQGLPLRSGIHEWLRGRVLNHGRVVLRADSARRDVDALLALSGLDALVTFVRCADDMPRTVGQPTVAQSWQAIAGRLGAMRVAPSQCVAYECEDESAAYARLAIDDVHLVHELS